ncbi:hypothetical protein V8C86DRAFT_2527246 [Haematococcus lacustris]
MSKELVASADWGSFAPVVGGRACLDPGLGLVMGLAMVEAKVLAGMVARARWLLPTTSGTAGIASSDGSSCSQHCISTELDTRGAVSSALAILLSAAATTVDTDTTAAAAGAAAAGMGAVQAAAPRSHAWDMFSSPSMSQTLTDTLQAQPRHHDDLALRPYLCPSPGQPRRGVSWAVDGGRSRQGLARLRAAEEKALRRMRSPACSSEEEPGPPSTWVCSRCHMAGSITAQVSSRAWPTVSSTWVEYLHTGCGGL